MIILLSPSKTLDLNASDGDFDLTLPVFRKYAFELSKIMKKKSVSDLQEMMDVSENIAIENVKRFKAFKSSFPANNTKAAIFTFAGDVYTGLEAASLDREQVLFSNNHVRILSGLYGVLKPLDRMQPYRLEMGRKLITHKGSNLYHFWGDMVTKEIHKDLKRSEGEGFILNLASDEYFKVINKKLLKAQILDIEFREERNGKLQFISYNAKKSRGQMARFIIENRISTKDPLKEFDIDGYTFEQELSNDDKWFFIKRNK